MFSRQLICLCALTVVSLNVDCLPSSSDSVLGESSLRGKSVSSPSVSSSVVHETIHPSDQMVNAAATSAAVSTSSSLKSLVKKRLRPGIGLGRGLVKATINTAKRARNVLQNIKDERAARQAPGLMAGAIAYGLASLPFLTLPLLIASPLALSRVFKSKSQQSEEEKETEKITSSLNEIFNVAGEILKNHVDHNSSTSQTAAKIAQALGLHPVTLDDDKVYPISPGSNIGDALFHPGSFAGSGYSHPKYKPYVFKQGLLTTTAKPSARAEDGKAMSMGKAKSLDSLDSLQDLTHDDVTFESTGSPITTTPSSTGSTKKTLPKISSKSKEQISTIAKEVLRTVSDGIKKFELEKNECKERLVCEVSQKYAGSSFKSWASALTHVLDLDSKVEKSKVGKNVILRSLYRGARSSLSDRNCAELFPNCS